MLAQAYSFERAITILLSAKKLDFSGVLLSLTANQKVGTVIVT
jgi:hypothetical protein